MVNIARYRWTEQEEGEILDALLAKATPPQELETKLVWFKDTLEEAKALKADEVNGISGLSTGYSEIDKLGRGIRATDIVVVFADTNVGKSLFVQNIALNVALRGEPVLFFGLEMSNAENTERIKDMGKLSDEEAENLPIIYPHPDAQLGYKDIYGIAEAAKKEGAVLIIVDLLHMFTTDAATRADGIEDVCREFKRVTRELQLPMILVSHINEDKYRSSPPDLPDLKGSSAIKQIASLALALWRDPELLDDPNAPLVVIGRKFRRKRPKNIRVELNISDTGRMTQPFDNLVSGSVKQTPQQEGLPY